MKSSNVAIIMPSFHDNDCLEIVLPMVHKALQDQVKSFDLYIVNDLGYPDKVLVNLAKKNDATVIDSPYNLGSQEAVLFGIRHVENSKKSYDYFVTMDSDGQDNPNRIKELLQNVEKSGGDAIAVGKRTGKRPEGKIFKTGYAIYKRLFKIFTGVYPDFGNFAAFDGAKALQICNSPLFAITYSLALPQLGKIIKVPMPREKRIAGKTRVGYRGLFLHAMRSCLPYLDIIALRVSAMSLIPLLLGAILLIVTSTLRLVVPEYTFPNWATTIAFGVVIISLQLLTICVLLFIIASLYKQIIANQLRVNEYIPK